MRKPIILICIFSFMFCSCKKDLAKPFLNPDTQTNSVTKITVNVAQGQGGCNVYSPCVPLNDGAGSYSCQFQGVSFILSNIRYVSYDNNGNPWKVVQGEPFLAQCTVVAPGNAITAYNMINSDNQFAALVYIPPSGDLTGVNNDISQYQTAFANWVSVANNAGYSNQPSESVPPDLFFTNPGPPLLSTYLNAATLIKVNPPVPVTGKLIRLQPAVLVVNSTATQPAIYSSFAMASSCYPYGGPIGGVKPKVTPPITPP